MTGYLFNDRNYLKKEEVSEKKILLDERVILALIRDHNFERRDLYSDNFFLHLFHCKRNQDREE